MTVENLKIWMKFIVLKYFAKNKTILVKLFLSFLENINL